MGKTYFTRYLCSIYGAGNPAGLLIYDPLGQYGMFPDESRYVPRGDSQAEFESVCQQLRGRKNVVFVVEEAERYLNQRQNLGSHAYDLCNRGRNWGIGIVAVTRRIQELSKTYFDLCSGAYFFKCGLKSRKYISDMIGKEELVYIRRLKPYHFLYYDVEKETSEVATLDISVPSRQHIETISQHAATDAQEEVPATRPTTSPGRRAKLKEQAQ